MNADKLLLASGYDLEGNKVKSRNKKKHKAKPKPKLKSVFNPKAPEVIQRMKDSRWIIKIRERSELSDGEKIIAQFLTDNGVEFVREQYGPKLFNPRTNKLLFFDFYLPKYNLVIEYDGYHHFKAVDGDVAKLEDVRFKDRIKNEFCYKNGIHLLRISGFKKIERMICDKIDRIAA